MVQKPNTQWRERLRQIVFVIILTCVLLMKDSFASGQILPASSEDRGAFSLSVTQPTESCYKFQQDKFTVISCGVACLRHSESTYLFGINHTSGQCTCCDYPLLPKVGGTDWTSYERCPSGYTEVHGKTTKYCFRLFWVPEYYADASRICRESTSLQNSTSELVRLNSLEKVDALEYLLKNLQSPEDVWIQGVRGNDRVWRYEDGSLMDNACPTTTSDKVDEFNMRFRPYIRTCSDRVDSLFSFACEANL